MSDFRCVLAPPPADSCQFNHDLLHKKLISMSESLDLRSNPLAGPDRITFQLAHEWAPILCSYASRIYSGDLYFDLIATNKRKNPHLQISIIVEPHRYRSWPRGILRPSLPDPCVEWFPSPSQQGIAAKFMHEISPEIESYQSHQSAQSAPNQSNEVTA